MNKIIIPLPAVGPRLRDIHRYNKDGKLMGVEDVTYWTDDEIKQFAASIQQRGDGSYAALKERSK